MRRPTPRTGLMALAAAALTPGLLAAAPAGAAHPSPVRGAHVLPANDGWASADGGTTGGAGADAAHTYTVATWDEFKQALKDGGDAPKVVKVRGTLDGMGGRSCEDYAVGGYTLDAYLAAYDPRTWGTAPPSGPQEEARAASAAAQGEQVRAYVPANTTIVGLGHGARVLGGSLQIKDTDNVVVRGITFEDAFDCFPQWDPTDGDSGAWNSEYDNLVVHGSTHVWIDHNTFTDGRRPDSGQPLHYGQLYQQHDGELDVVRGADLVTVSWNAFTDHDKTLMIGNSDGAGATDRGKLRVTLHHNLFRDVVERAPRVRFGRVDAYNNHFVVAQHGYAYSFGIGIESQLVAEKNTFALPDGVGAAKILKKWKDAPVTTRHNYVNGAPVDLLAAHNAANPANPLRAGAGWTPVLRTRVDSPRVVPALVTGRAGAPHRR
ncbi:pectate lyase [Streptomyces agglomeratus]|uniref:Pectate lyase n=1 Tax=Streptomyces agglomeratus TaxID=285458 RepID=A0A1E5P3B0_9ACTN|nr:pectate lyase [Streptomyces agglomeratus]OEJ23824.1 pectate lyase [Streptomyces agglomeratus]OEJ43420.1 pectate lyase [Streptomyces agglomeratus]